MLTILLSAAAFASPLPVAVPAKPADAAITREKPPRTAKRRLKPMRLLRRIARAEPDLALRLSSWGIDRTRE